MVNTYVKNFRPLVRAYGGVEAVRGVFDTPGFKLYPESLNIVKAQPLADNPEYAGTFFQDYTPTRGPIEITGTYAQQLTYEDGPMLARHWIAGGVTGVTDGNTVPGFTYLYKPAALLDNLDTLSLEYGFDGIPYECSMLVFNRGTISGDIDNQAAAWMFSGDLLGRSKELKNLHEGVATAGSATTLTQTGAGWTTDEYAGGWLFLTDATGQQQQHKVLSNTATVATIDGTPNFSPAPAAGTVFALVGAFTPAIADRTRERIAAPGTQLFLDVLSALGSMQIFKRFISFSVTQENNISTKRFMEDITTVSDKLDFGFKRVTGTIRLEFSTIREYLHWKNLTPEKIRIKQPNGSIIDPTTGARKTASIDVYVAYWDSMPDDDRQNNVTVNCQFKGYVDATEGVPWGVSFKNALSTLPT